MLWTTELPITVHLDVGHLYVLVSDGEHVGGVDTDDDEIVGICRGCGSARDRVQVSLEYVLLRSTIDQTLSPCAKISNSLNF